MRNPRIRNRLSRSKGRRVRAGKGLCEKPRIDPLLTRIFKRIGTPRPAPIRPDPFQLEALEKIGRCDVVVSAPTGSGKTWIAEQAISRCLSQGMRTWYASPLKALSNSIYDGFCRQFGAHACGILTGDRKENPGAPVIVGTTEILRNQLYDAMHQGVSVETDLVILDEAHYLGDPDRGVVWEEVLIYLSPRVRLLLLSATISNDEEIAAWLEGNRKTETCVVRSHTRPVPLEMLFLFPDGLLTPLSGKRGLVPKVKKFLDHAGKERQRLNYGDIIRCLGIFDLLPAIFFLKSRADCDRALLTCRTTQKPWNKKERCRSEVREFVRMYPHLQGHRQLDSLSECGVASHHAGQLPYWKVLVERMMTKGCLDAIFSTSTVAAGVNFPARTVVLVQSDRFNGHRFSDLTASELHQMTGRAGRRGKDNIGFVLVLPGVHQDPRLIHDLKEAPPEPLNSQIQINFSMTLNLLLSHTPEEVKHLLDRSFASFQQRKEETFLHRRWGDLIDSLEAALPEGKCDTGDPYEVMEWIAKRGELKRRARSASRKEQPLLASFTQQDTEPDGQRRERKTEKPVAERLPCEDCEHSVPCHTDKRSEVTGLLRTIRSLGGHGSEMQAVPWLNFKRHLRFLKYTGFVDSEDRLTADGEWASKLRLDHPLLIAEAIRKGGFAGLSPPVMAGCLAPFVWDRFFDRDLVVEAPLNLSEIWGAFERMLERIEVIRVSMVKRRFENPEIFFWPAAALFLWAKGCSWEEVLLTAPVDEGDVTSLIARTADHLRQMTNLKESHPELAATAAKATALVLREPVYIE
jgi:superfamily II RNA helicase